MAYVSTKNNSTIPKSRRLVRIHITPDLIAALLMGPCQKGFRLRFADNSVPETAQAVSAGYDHASDCIVLFLEDASFAEVEPGNMIPQIRPMITREEVP